MQMFSYDAMQIIDNVNECFYPSSHFFRGIGMAMIEPPPLLLFFEVVLPEVAFFLVEVLDVFELFRECEYPKDFIKSPGLELVREVEATGDLLLTN